MKRFFSALLASAAALAIAQAACVSNHLET
jgi:hypothetical protein